MAQPIYKLFLAKPSAAWYQLSQEEQTTLLGKVGETLEKVGGKSTITCDSSWASEQTSFWGVEQYPDLDALQKHAQLLNELNWFQYIESMTVLGTEMSQP